MEIRDAMVLSVARAAMDDPEAQLLGWSSRRIGGGAAEEIGNAAGVQRITGTAITEGHEAAWSVILKVLRHSPFQLDPDTEVDNSAPTGFAYWHREADV